jgi:hypothetical protein
VVHHTSGRQVAVASADRVGTSWRGSRPGTPGAESTDLCHILVYQRPSERCRHRYLYWSNASNRVVRICSNRKWHQAAPGPCPNPTRCLGYVLLLTEPGELTRRAQPAAPTAESHVRDRHLLRIGTGQGTARHVSVGGPSPPQSEAATGSPATTVPCTPIVTPLCWDPSPDQAQLRHRR